MSWGTPRGSKIIASEVCESAMSAVGSTKRRSKLGKSMTATVSNTKNHSGGSESDVAQSCLFATLWTVAYQAPPSMGFSRQEYWSGLPFPSPGDLPDPEIEPGSPSLEADTLTSEPPGLI